METLYCEYPVPVFNCKGCGDRPSYNFNRWPNERRYFCQDCQHDTGTCYDDATAKMKWNFSFGNPPELTPSVGSFTNWFDGGGKCSRCARSVEVNYTSNSVDFNDSVFIQCIPAALCL